jgi:hypothetical protein
MDQQHLRWMAVFLAVVLLIAGWSLFDSAAGTGQILGRFSTLWSIALGLYAVFMVLGLVVLAWVYRYPEMVVRTWIDRLEMIGSRLGAMRWVLLLVLLGSQVWLLLGPIGERLEPIPLRLLLFTLSAFLGALLLPRAWGPYPVRWMVVMMLGAFSLFVGNELNFVRTYPFKLTWSEGNRIWDYSLYFGQSRYQVQGSLTYPGYMAPGRHGLWGLAFLVPGLEIWGARLWNAILWIAPPLLLGWALLRRLPDKLKNHLGVFWVLWVFLFISQGPIYAPLLLAAALIAWGYNSARPYRTALMVAVACYYAGTSRWTWMATPALWAGLWAIFDSDKRRVWWRRALWPIGLGLIGLAGGWLSQIAVEAIHPSEGPVFATSFSQALLWYRLFPSATNPIGILPAAALATGPLMAGLGLAIQRKWIRLDWLEALATGAVLLSTFAVGLVASVKIGGGNNLHNLDMFLVSLVITTALLIRRLEWSSLQQAAGGTIQLTTALILLIPVVFILQVGAPLRLPQQDVVEQSIAQIQDFIEPAATEGEILFIDQRQLLTFGQVDVPLVVDYELKDLTNKAMIGDPQLFASFYDDLRTGRFSVIVTGHLPNEWRGREHPFGEEDDAQLEFIYLPLQQYYQPALQLDEVGIWLLVPIESAIQSSNSSSVSSQ